MATKSVEKPTGQKDKAQSILGRYDRLKKTRDSFYAPLWEAAAEWFAPRKSELWGAGRTKTPGESGWVDSLHDITGMLANERFAAWLMTNTSPANSRWFAFASPPHVRARLGNRAPMVDRWWQHVTAVTLEQLHASKFYTAKHEAVLDRNTFGTCSLGVFRGRAQALNFRTIECATFVFALDDEGNPDTVIREFKLSARQAAQQFGKESLGEKVRGACDNPKKQDDEFTFLHAVFPNSDRNPQYQDIGNKPFKSCYVSREDEVVVQESGFDELPYAISRFLSWSGDSWGWAPAMLALPQVRETNFLKMQMNALGELAAFPPLAIPSSLQGQIDARAGGVNYYDENNPQALPRALYETVGRFDIGKDLIESGREFINKAFYSDVVSMFASLEREITAFEASQLAAEKLDVFSPYYHRLITELDTPVLQRVFSILLAEGFYEAPPPELVEVSEDGLSATVPTPEVTYLSRLALAIQAHEIQSFDALMARAAQLATIDPALAAQFVSNYDLDRAARGLGRNLGVPVDWQKDPDVLAEERAAQAEAQQAALAAEAAPKLAQAAKTVDETSPAMKNRLAALAN